MREEIHTGTVKWFNNKAKYGFILDENQDDVFVHFSVIEGGGYKTLKKNEKVLFEISSEGPRKRAARVIRRSAVKGPEETLGN